MKRAWSRVSRFGKFSLVGLLGAVLQLMLLSLLTKLFRVPVLAATPLAVELVLLHNFVWHERFTWSDRRFKSIRQRITRLWRFQAGNGLASVLGNTLIIYCLVERCKAPVLPSAMGAIALCSLMNFFLADRWVYASR